MSLILDTSISNLFPAAPQNHVLMIEKFSGVSFAAQEVNLPGLSTPPVMVANPRSSFPYAPTKITFEPLVVKFFVDEELSGYKQIYEWMTGVTDVDDNNRSVDYYNQQRIDSKTPWTATPITVLSTNIGLTIVNANKTPIIRVLFFNAQPTSLSDIQFSVTADTLTTMTCSVSFVYDTFRFVNLR